MHDEDPLSIRQLQVFVALTEQGSFTKAARYLRLSQSTVSGHISDLERRLGMRLVERDRSGVRPTDAGRTRYWTGRGGVVMSNDPVELTEEVARAYDIRWLLLDHADSVPLAAAVLSGDAPAWVGPVAWDDGRMALYPVCTSAGDGRCESFGS